MSTATLIKENIELGLAYRFRSSVHYHHEEVSLHSGMQAHMAMERLRVLHLDTKAAGREQVTGFGLSSSDFKVLSQ